MENVSIYNNFFCSPAKGSLSNYIPCLYQESFVLIKKALCNGVSLEVYAHFNFQLRT